MRALAILLLVTSTGSAERATTPATALAGSLPAGWSLRTRDRELVIRRDQTVRVAGHHLENPHIGNMPAPVPTHAPAITLALRFRVEPRWDAAKLAAARAANAKLYAAMTRLRAHHHIDDIPTSKGRPLPRTTDEQRRLAAYEADRARAAARLVRLPSCTIGDVSLFDGPETYAQLDLMVDPPSAMREAYAIVELVKRRCRGPEPAR